MEQADFEKLGYTFTSKYTPNKIGSTYHVIVTDKDGKEVVHTKCSYGNGSGHGYAVMGAKEDAIAELKAYIEREDKETEKVEYDTNFLSTLLEWGYISEYGYDTNDNLTILFDSWEQLQGKSHYEDDYDKNGEYKSFHTVIDRPSVFQKLRDLADRDLLKPSITKTIQEAECCFTDEYSVCMECGRIINREWEGLHWIEELSMEICDDCLNDSDEAIECLIEEAREDFKKALPVMISEDKIEEMGYTKLDENDDFSTRMEQWGEYSYGCHNVHHSVIEELCKKYNGFPKLTGVWQFDAEYNAYFPTSTVEKARLELKELAGLEVS